MSETWATTPRVRTSSSTTATSPTTTGSSCSAAWRNRRRPGSPTSMGRSRSPSRQLGNEHTDHDSVERLRLDNTEVTAMRAAIFKGAGKILVEYRDKPEVVEATDAVVRVVMACVCGSDL